MIRLGRVTVDGRPAHLGQKVDPDQSQVAVDDVPLPIRPGLVYYLAYKPRGVVSTASDPQGRPTVVDLVPAEPRVVPVGRLDADSEGLLILTNDGDLTQRITHPRHGVPKTYLARTEGIPSDADLRTLLSGVDLDDGPSRALKIKLVDATGNEALVQLVMGEGRKREVRRMLAALGFPVKRLVRTAIGPLRDRRLRAGQWRGLTADEVRSLYEASLEQ